MGIFSGAVTNTPSLGAGQQILTDLHIDPALIGQMGMGYAMAYPMGICGILLVMWLIRVFFKINIDDEAKTFSNQQNSTKEALHTINIAIKNPNLDGLLMQDIPLLNEDAIVCSRLKRGDNIMVPMPSTIIQLGDFFAYCWLERRS